MKRIEDNSTLKMKILKILNEKKGNMCLQGEDF